MGLVLEQGDLATTRPKVHLVRGDRRVRIDQSGSVFKCSFERLDRILEFPLFFVNPADVGMAERQQVQ